MNWCVKGLSSILHQFKGPHLISVRNRYHAEKIAKGPLQRRFGYKDRILQEGLLPRLENAKPLPKPVYRPKNSWSEHPLHPTRIIYNVNAWLRGVKGNEYQVLLRKRKIWAKGIFPYVRPTRWHDINKRIKFLYKFLNRKTKT
ncbi:hypothetical protein L9F63_014224 [Diploptera punctata]|uniref:Large ribosomal subunit protein mL51 n=1 Tax=Diploptera punctata TaxID=6984 RepID=A0AAD8A8H8_DIPPU|nr:hypothetical protein L9F63_014224 [Diploptera punctata]